jgi:hypothetical protein
LPSFTEIPAAIFSRNLFAALRIGLIRMRWEQSSVGPIVHSVWIGWLWCFAIKN